MPLVCKRPWCEYVIIWERKCIYALKIYAAALENFSSARNRWNSSTNIFNAIKMLTKILVEF